MKEENGRNKWKERAKTILIIILMIIIIILLLRECDGRDSATAIIDEPQNVELNDTDSGMVRIKMSPQVNIENGIMKELNFCNYNKDRQLKVVIKCGDKRVYESPMVKSGKILESAQINSGNLKKGENDAIAEVYSYDLNGNLAGQTNVKIVLNYIS